VGVTAHNTVYTVSLLVPRRSTHICLLALPVRNIIQADSQANIVYTGTLDEIAVRIIFYQFFYAEKNHSYRNLTRWYNAEQ